MSEDTIADVKAVAQQVRARMKTVMGGMDKLVQNEVYVGIPSTSVRYDSDLSNAELGYIQETGAPEQNLPARPFLEPGMRKAAPAVAKILAVGAEKAVAGDAAAVTSSLRSAGMTAVNIVRAEIRRGIPPPLAERTLADRRRRGVPSRIPLLDTHQLINSITYMFRDKKKR